MRILIDGDHCPISIKKICHDLSKTYHVQAYLFYEDNFNLDDPDDELIDIPSTPSIPGRIDYKLSTWATRRDIIVTHDDNLATIIYPQVLAVIHPAGFVYNAWNIDQLLYKRYMIHKVHNPERDKKARIKKRSFTEESLFKQVLTDYIKNF